MNNMPTWLILTLALIGLIGTVSVAVLGYFGNQRIAAGKADQSFVDLLKTQVTELKAEVEKLKAALLFSDNERKRLTDENIQLMRKVLAL